ncbi:polyprenyl synthetase family protein [Olivibacter sp. SDN3]|uniref:polyprenyl synthetase family protein n=1 Tax=Olivibacter sp. SDN3 TaxID=2764720 RepID=UPI00165103D0|nr:polyprenyl synthetase family protein [Olivibacter sp. SDN3]QNL48938.1 polyprenyl synthetase family protein [Olivibacter sp. SDN3]
MYSIADLQLTISQALITKQISREPHTLYEPISYFLSLGGKRLRPVLTLLATDLFSEAIEKSIPAALAIELFHNFTLMHDDIMDQAPLRRGKTSVHEKWNTNTAILSGDAMLIMAYQLLSETDHNYLHQLFASFNKMALEVCEGQQLDLDFGNTYHVTEEQYIQMIRLKTSVLLGTALELGAIISGANDSDRNLIYQFGVNMGIAFQLQDDILDVYGDPDKFGKQIGGDIIENKKTFLLINALELSRGKDAVELKSLVTNNEVDVQYKIASTKKIYDKLNIRSLAEKAKKDFANQAFKALNALSIEQEKTTVLRNFAKSLLIRES